MKHNQYTPKRLLLSPEELRRRSYERHRKWLAANPNYFRKYPTKSYGIEAVYARIWDEMDGADKDWIVHKRRKGEQEDVYEAQYQNWDWIRLKERTKLRPLIEQWYKEKYGTRIDSLSNPSTGRGNDNSGLSQ